MVSQIFLDEDLGDWVGGLNGREPWGTCRLEFAPSGSEGQSNSTLLMITFLCQNVRENTWAWKPHSVASSHCEVL